MTKQGWYSQYLFLFSFKQGCENYANDSSHQFCVIKQKEGPCRAGCLVAHNAVANALTVHSKRLFAPWQNRASPPHFPYSFPAQYVKKYDNHFSHQFCVMNKAGDKRCLRSGLEEMDVHQKRSGFHIDFCFFLAQAKLSKQQYFFLLHDKNNGMDLPATFLHPFGLVCENYANDFSHHCFVS